MGLIKIGILGGFRKKTGTVVGSYWRKLDVIKALPRSSGKAPTQQQIEQKQKFGLVTSFLGKAGDLINHGFKSDNALTPMNNAVTYHLGEAIMGTYPNYAIDMEKFKYSIGNLELPDVVEATPTAGAQIAFSWDRAGEIGTHISPLDIVSVVAFNVQKQRFVKKIIAGTRGDDNFTLQLPETFVGDTVHLYISFSSTTRKMNSDTMYLGTATVLA